MTNHHTSLLTRADANGRLLSRSLLRQMIPVSDMTIWRWERAGKFPRHLAIHGRNYWLLSEVENWVFSQPRDVGHIMFRDG